MTYNVGVVSPTIFHEITLDDFVEACKRAAVKNRWRLKLFHYPARKGNKPEYMDACFFDQASKQLVRFAAWYQYGEAPGKTCCNWLILQKRKVTK